MTDNIPEDPKDRPAEPGAFPPADYQKSLSIPLPGTDRGDELLGLVEVRVNLVHGDSVRITIETLPEEETIRSPGAAPASAPLRPSARRPRRAAPAGAILAGTWVESAFQGLAAGFAWLTRPRLKIGQHQVSFEEAFFGLALVVYLSTRLIGLVNFPIYFFTDEAVQTVLAADFVRDDFQNYDKDFFPTYFVNGNQYNLSVSVYLQVLPYLIFGKSVAVTRGTSVLITLLGAAAMGLILRDFFKTRYWWAGTLILSIAPAWFLHSRTAFETVEMTALYACFLYFYLLYRYRAPRFLYPALVLGSLVFYAYSAGQLVMVVTGILLLFSDLRYHWQNRRTSLIGLGVLVLLALPYLRFLITRGAENFRHLQILNSYLTEPISTAEKIQRYFSQYLFGLSPSYWFLPNPHDLPRHQMKDYGHLLRATFPFAVLGLGVCLKNVRSSAHRVLIIALLAAPTGAALVQIGITRVLVFVIPASLLITLGVVTFLGWLETWRLPYRALTVALFVALAGYNIGMLRDALVNGPTWFRDYGLGGMQYGANQVFSAIKDYLKINPDMQVVLSPSWSNGTDVVARFYDVNTLPVQLGSIEGWLFERKPLDSNTVFVMIPQEYDLMTKSLKFTGIQVDETLPYPDGTTGFYFVRLRYVNNIDAILAAEREARKQLKVETISVEGQQVPVRFSQLDMGGIQNAFDGNLNTIIRSLEANPLVIELDFPQPRNLSGLTVRVGGPPTRVTARLVVDGKDVPMIFEKQEDNTPLPKDVAVDFGAAYPVTSLRLEIKSINDEEPAHVHLWEVTFR